MDDTPVLFQDMALLKPPGGREKPWHQDCAYFNYPLGTTIIGVWIALDHADANNGCLHILPGTHREGPVNHFKRRDWQICDTDVQTERDVVVPLAPGGCLLWHGMTHHGSPTNPLAKNAPRFTNALPTRQRRSDRYRGAHATLRRRSSRR